MAERNELEIVLSLVDKASSELKKITEDIKKDTKTISKESEKAGKSLGEGMKDAGKGLKDFRREMFIVVASIGAVTMAAKAWAENNLQARETLDSIGVSINRVMGALGSIMMPLIDLASKGLEKLAQLIEFSARGWVGLWALITGKGLEGAIKAMDDFSKGLTERGNLQEMNNQMKQMTDELNRINLMYLTGAISAQQYYNVLASNNVANFQNMQTRMQLTQQMTTQENLMRNQSLMDYSTDITTRMGLLKTLQSYHHTVYSSMMDFANMFIQKFSTGMTTALTSVIMGTKRAGEAFKEFGISMVTAIVEFVIQYGIQMLIAAALSKIILASTVAQAGAIAAAWLPAAIFASIATMGGADAAGATAFAAATGASMAVGLGTIVVSKAASLLTGGAGGGYAEGGWVGLNGPQMALVGERGPEYIVPNNRLNNLGSEASINITLNAVINNKLDITEVAEELGYEIERQRRYSRRI